MAPIPATIPGFSPGLLLSMLLDMDLPSSALCWSAGVFFYLALRSRSLSEEAQEDLRTEGDGDASALVVRLSLMGPGGQ